jgi:hypothetical protein
MRKIVIIAVLSLMTLAIVAVADVGTGFAEDQNAARAKCSKATLDGTYLFANDGVDVTGNKQLPLAAAGYDVYDGNGKLIDSVASVNFNGQVARKVHGSGTYTLKADCTGTVTFAGRDAPRLDLFVAPDGSKFTQVGISPPEVVSSGFEERVTAKRVGP